MGRKRIEDISVRDSLTKDEPVTRFFYEYRGERAVDPSTMVENGITLWQEQIYANQARDNGHLWKFAESLLDARQETLIYSWVEWLKFSVMMGVIVPEKWDRYKPYPYKGLLISAIYFQEAQRLCIENRPERAWHILVTAYYHLGMNTTSSAPQNLSKAAQILHAARTEKVRALVIAMLSRIKRDGTAESIERAKDEVVRLLREKGEQGVVKEWLSEFDTIISEKTKGRTKAKQKNDVFDRIRNLLNTWSLPSGPYPEVAEAFSQFKKKKLAAVTIATNEGETSEERPADESHCFLRFVNLLEDGYVLTEEIL